MNNNNLSLTRLQDALQSVFLFIMIGGLSAIGNGTSAQKHPSTPTKSGQNTAKPIVPVHPATSTTLKPVTAPIRLTYAFKIGEKHRYTVRAYFNGHIPPFSTGDDSPPIHLLLDMVYTTTVKKTDDKGAEVSFEVESGTPYLLDKEIITEGKIDENNAVEFPLPLSQIQATLNVVATIKPDGTVTNVKGGDTSKVKIDLGFDLRKLFLVTAPIVFSEKAVSVAQDWSFEDGLLGHKPGQTSYKGKLIAAQADTKRLSADLSQDASTLVNNKLDKEGNSADKPENAVGTLIGKVTLGGTMKYGGSASTLPTGGLYTARLMSGRLTMNVDLKRTIPDPDMPGKMLVTPIDVKAIMFVKADDKPVKPVTKTTAEAR